jgi:hypothetical protein
MFLGLSFPILKKNLRERECVSRGVILKFSGEGKEAALSPGSVKTGEVQRRRRGRHGSLEKFGADWLPRDAGKPRAEKSANQVVARLPN